MEERLAAGTGTGLAHLSIWEFGALKTLTQMLGGIAAVEHFSTSSSYLFEGTLDAHPCGERESRK